MPQVSRTDARQRVISSASSFTIVFSHRTDDRPQLANLTQDGEMSLHDSSTGGG